MSNPGQCKVTLQLLVDFVNNTKIDPAHVAIIAPYKANVAIMKRWIQEKPECSVLRCVVTAAVESFQSQEADIARVVLGTTKHAGPSIARDMGCPKAMLSRHRSVG